MGLIGRKFYNVNDEFWVLNKFIIFLQVAGWCNKITLRLDHLLYEINDKKTKYIDIDDNGRSTINLGLDWHNLQIKVCALKKTTFFATVFFCHTYQHLFSVNLLWLLRVHLPRCVLWLFFVTSLEMSNLCSLRSGFVQMRFMFWNKIRNLCLSRFETETGMCDGSKFLITMLNYCLKIAITMM